MDAWQKAWREGVVPHLSTAGLRALERALTQDDPALVQGVTVDPPDLDGNEAKPVEAACAICFCGWKGDGLQTVLQVEEYFAKVVGQAAQALGDFAGAKWFVNWHDGTPRQEMRRELLKEVCLELALRSGGEATIT